MFAIGDAKIEIPYGSNNPQLTAPRAVQSNMVYSPRSMFSLLVSLCGAADKRCLLGTMFRHIGSLLLLVAFYTSVAAAGYGGAGGTNRKGQEFRIPADGEGQIILFESARQMRRGEQGRTLQLDCDWTGDSGYALDCRENARSALAGAAYIRKTSRNHRSVCGTPSDILVCKVGCDPIRIPSQFIEAPWEC